MSTYRKEWDCCDSVTETQGWEPKTCPFCASPAAAVPDGALPPVPSWIQNASFGIHDWREVAVAMQAYARAAVEADRARQQDMPVRLAGAPADAPTIKGTDSNVQKVHIAGDGETLDEKAENALLWCYRRLKNSYGRLPFVEEAVAGLRERTAAAGAARQGGDGAPESGDVSADRAQQGEPVDLEAVNDMRIAFKVQIDNLIDIAERYAARTREADEEEHDYIMGAINHAREVVGPYSYNGTYRAATKAAAPADAPKWGPVQTVGDMVRNLLTLDQAAPIFTAFHLSVGGERRCKTNIVTISRERVIDGKWIDSSRKDVPYAHVIWAKPDERATPVPDTGIPTAGEVPVAWAVVSVKGGIHKLAITKESADRKAARWQEEWPNNGCTVRPLIYGDSRAPVSGTPTSGAVEKAGWKWVPVEPTQAMESAGGDAYGEWENGHCVSAIYEAMLAAAPHPSEAKAGEDA